MKRKSAKWLHNKQSYQNKVLTEMMSFVQCFVFVGYTLCKPFMYWLYSYCIQLLDSLVTFLDKTLDPKPSPCVRPAIVYLYLVKQISIWLQTCIFSSMSIDERPWTSGARTCTSGGKILPTRTSGKIPGARSNGTSGKPVRCQVLYICF